jgi:hypothetical protein
MGILKDKLLESDVRPRVIPDCVRLVDREVAAKRGVTGLMIKGGYKAFTKLMPNIVEKAVDHLLDDFVRVLDVLHGEYMEKVPDQSPPFDTWMSGQKSRVANDLLGVTDDIMARSDKGVLKKIYGGLRPVAQKNVAEAVPGIGTLVKKYIG